VKGVDWGAGMSATAAVWAPLSVSTYNEWLDNQQISSDFHD